MSKDTNNAMEILKTYIKRQRMNSWKTLYIQTFQQQVLLIQEQHPLERSPIYALTLTTDEDIQYKKRSISTRASNQHNTRRTYKQKQHARIYTYIS
jgi:hypothetical protein